MKKAIASCAAFLCGTVLLIAGENIVKNGKFTEVGKDGKPVNWRIIAQNGGKVSFDPKGLDKGGSVRFESDGKTKKESFRCAQVVTGVVKSNATYRLSFMARGKDFDAKESYFVVYVDGWSKQSGFGPIGQSRQIKLTPEWKRYTGYFSVPAFKKDATLALYGIEFKGTIEIADISFEPIKK